MPLPIRVTPLRRGDRALLERWVRGRTAPRRLVERARIVLLSAAGTAGDAICETVGVARPTLSRWLDRYAAEGAAAWRPTAPARGGPGRSRRRMKRASSRGR